MNLQLESEVRAGDVDLGIIHTNRRDGQIIKQETREMKSRRRKSGRRDTEGQAISEDHTGEKRQEWTELDEAGTKTSPWLSSTGKEFSMPARVTLSGKHCSKFREVEHQDMDRHSKS